MNLFIAMPGAGYVTSRAHAALSWAVAAGVHYWTKKFGEDVRVEYRVTDRMEIAAARNLITRQALEREADFVWWLDDDMEPPTHTLERLHSFNAPIASAFCAQRSLPPKVMAFRYFQDKFGVLIGDDFTGQWTVDAVGMACVLIKKEVLEAVWKETNGKPFQYGPEMNDGKPKYGTEEMYFFELASQKFGYKTVLDADLDVGHIGLQRFDKSLVGSWKRPVADLLQVR